MNFNSLKQILLEALTRQGWKDQVKKKCKGIRYFIYLIHGRHN